MKRVPRSDSDFFSPLFDFEAMWQPPWHGHPFQGCPPSPSIGSPLGPHPGVLPCGGCGGCSPPVHPMGPQLSSCGPCGQWLPQGPGGWHPSNMMNSPGMNCDCHHPAVSGPPVAHGLLLWHSNLVL